MSLKALWHLVTAATGFDCPTVRDLELVGERSSTLARLFNVQEGFTRTHDTLPARNLSQPMSGGPAEGQVVEFEPMLDEYCRIMGWDSDGIPRRRRCTGWAGRRNRRRRRCWGSKVVQLVSV
jgi:aldehyde:ferredoxin oxidoreductase